METSESQIINISTENYKNTGKILSQMNSFRKEGLFCDLILECDDHRTFLVHKLVMASASPYFRAMFKNEMLESHQPVIHLKEIDSESLGVLIDFAYTADIKIDVENILNVLAAGNMLCFEDVENCCIDFLCKNLNIENCIDICSVADSLNCEELRRLAELYVTRNFRWLVRNSNINLLSAGQLESILSNDGLCISSETEVYEAVLSWIKYNPNERKKCFATLLRHVRLVLISRKYLVDRIMREPLVMDDTECRCLVLAALDHILLPERRLASCPVEVLPRKVVNRTLFVLGGEADKRALKNVEVYDFANDTWSCVAPMNMPRKNVAAAVLDGVLYAVGGTNENYQDLVTVEKFDFDTGMWSAAASLTRCKGALCVAVIDGWLYALGGSNGGAALKHVERYDPLTDEWTQITSMRLPRSHFGATALSGKIYAIGGYCGISEVEHCEYFDPSTSKWHEITCMNKARKNHAVSVHGDRIYAIGGSNSLGPLNSIEKFNPDLNMWLVIKSSFCLRTGLSVVPGFSSESESQEFIIVGGHNSSNVEHNEIKTLDLSSPDYNITKMSTMKQNRAFAGVAIL